MANLATVPRQAQVGERGRPSPFRKTHCVNGHDLSITRRRSGKGNQTYCYACSLESHRKCRANKREYYNTKLYEAKIRRLFGIEPVEYAEMLVRQQGRCFICKVKPKKLNLDHDHSTGKARKLLCNKCNVTLGAVNDSPEILKAMLKYLADHGVN